MLIIAGLQQFVALERKATQLLRDASSSAGATDVEDVKRCCYDLLSRTDVTAPSHFAVHQVKCSPIFRAAKSRLEALTREVEKEARTQHQSAHSTSHPSLVKYDTTLNLLSIYQTVFQTTSKITEYDMF